MDLLEKYKEYRKIQVELHRKIIDKCVGAEVYNKSAEMMGIVKNNEIILESNYESDAIFDFNVYESKKQGKNSVSQYIESAKETTVQEDELLTAMVKSYTRLYEVVERDEEKGIVLLKGAFDDSNELLKVIDIGFSKTLDKNKLVFTRLIQLDEFCMTSGLGFIFSANHKQYLFKRSRKFMKKINSGDEYIDRFIAFFQLNRSDGLPTVHQHID